jgi:SAM-dependent methyltransferase
MADDRHKLAYQVRYALRHPERIRPFLRRSWRDLKLRVRTRGDHVSYYREVMRHDVAANPRGAVGTPSRERWLALGRLQFDYLLEHGLRPEHRILEIGCGNLRAGWRLIEHLEPGHYHGIDISPDVLLAANRTLVEQGLQDCDPNLRLVDDLRLDHLPSAHFDVIHAHSVFSHCPLEVIIECFDHIGRVLRPDGFFDFTFNATAGEEHHVLREDYYYRPETLLRAAHDRGFKASFMEDWESRHKQSKIRLWLPSA